MRVMHFERDLNAIGLPTERAIVVSRALTACDAALDALHATHVGRVSAWVPGRIEVFGKHTDYAGGQSLLTAVEQGFSVRAAPRSDTQIRIVDAISGAAFTTSLSSHLTAPNGHWSNYIATVVRRIAMNFPAAQTGVDIAFTSDLPIAAGVSSSTALMISVFSAIAAVNDLSMSDTWLRALPTRTALASYMGAVENGGTFNTLAGDAGVGTLGGCQDQTAILCAEQGSVVRYSWMPVSRVSASALPATHRFVVASSGIVAEKSAGARERYNRASLMVRHLLREWNVRHARDDRSLAAAASSSSIAHEQLRAIARDSATPAFTIDALTSRLNQFLLENFTLIPRASNAFRDRDWQSLGDTALESQRAAEEWLGNQIAETSALVRIACERGAVAASAFGAGFGGSVWALVAASDADAFETDWRASYIRQFPAAAPHAMFFSTNAGPGARVWPDEAPGTYSLPL
jgi:galactokinase